MTKLAEVILYDVIGARPAAGIPGRLFYATDTQALSRDNGSSWDNLTMASGTVGSKINVSAFEYLPSPGVAGDVYLTSNGVELVRSDGVAQRPWGPIYPFTQPDNSLFVWRNQGSAEIDITHGGIFLSIPAASAYNLRIREMALPTPPYTVEVAFIPSPGFYGGQFGLCLIDSASGKIEGVEDTDYFQVVSQFASVTSRSSTAGNNRGVANNATVHWHRVSDNNVGNRTWDSSYDGQHWFRIYQTSSISFLTPDKIGFYGNSYNVSLSSGVTLLSWKQT